MQLEKLRKSHNKEIIIGGLIIVCVISAITITTTRAKYKLIEDIPLARGTINYTPDKEKPVITNVETSVTKTEINVTVSATDNIGVIEYWYQIDNNTPIKGTGNTYKFTGLSAGATYIVKVYVKDTKGNQSDTTTKSVQTTPNTASETILDNITPKTTTPNFANVATTNEGVYKVADGMYGGYSYYWRGAVTNNYVKFGGFCWRIIRINGDKTIRLIYDGASCHANGTNTAESIAVSSIAYNALYGRSEYVGWTYSTGSQRTTGGTASNVKTQTDSWFNSNITGTNLSKVAYGKFCNDRNTASGSIWFTSGSATFYYAATERLQTNKKPTLSCPSGDVYTLKVGAITADEVSYAGGVYHSNNSSYYLYNGQWYWTMSPYDWASSSNARVFFMDNTGNLGNNFVYTNNPGVRPVINLKSNITFSSGNGSLDNPYVVE